MYIIKLAEGKYYCDNNDSKVTKSVKQATKIKLSKEDAEQYLNYKKSNSYSSKLFVNAILQEI
jgi:aspartate/tyrosine/aromatic aminotransferase